jgi:starch phosphorylase
MAQKRVNRGKKSGAQRDVFERVTALAKNLWWTWNPDAQRLFASLEPREWEATNQAPLRTLARLSPERRAVLRDNPEFLAQLDRVEHELEQYLSAEPWHTRNADAGARDLQVAYFCAEFACHESLPLYSGGLGVLAGDHLKSASDLGIPLVAVGLFYHQGYYRQEIRLDGTTRVVRPTVHPDELPVEDTGKRITLRIGKKNAVAKIWKLTVGRVPVYLLDTDLPKNPPEIRALSYQLYGGDNLYRIQQEVLLGVGGMLALDALGIRPSVYHLNEGHAAFCALELFRRHRVGGRSLEQATEEVRQQIVFTTHTPVEAGHDRFSPERAVEHLGALAKQAGLSKRELLAFGRVDPEDTTETFCMTVLALKLARWVNGVSALHGKVSREMWHSVYDTTVEETPISHITNGIHSQSWLAPEADRFYAEHLKPQWVGATPKSDWWQKAEKLPADKLWELRGALRRALMSFVRKRLEQQLLRAGAPAEEVLAARSAFREDALTIGFARRFATYKRAPLVFTDRDRLAALLSDPKRPVQIIFAGKAHPADTAGQEFVRRVYEETRQPDLRGKVVLLEDYDMNVGRMLTSGADVWLNNPLRPMEASGTSGMKPPLHGGLNCSILDGWWPEAFDGTNGWEIGGGAEFTTQDEQDEHDAKSLYAVLENEVVPAFYERDEQGLPRRWLKMCARSMVTVCSKFSTHRMVGDYVQEFYWPAHGAGRSAREALGSSRSRASKRGAAKATKTSAPKVRAGKGRAAPKKAPKAGAKRR